MSPLKRSGLLKRTPIKQKGPTAEAWQIFRNEKLERDKDEDGLIMCQDSRLGLPACGIRSSSPDLHHNEGRDGKLLFDESKMSWLVRNCHSVAHNQR